MFFFPINISSYTDIGDAVDIESTQVQLTDTEKIVYYKIRYIYYSYWQLFFHEYKANNLRIEFKLVELY